MYRDNGPDCALWPTTRRTALIGAVALVAQCSLAAATPLADLPGWGATRWGMSRDALSSAVGPSLVKLATPLTYGRLVVRDTLPGQRIAGRPFVILFQIDPATETLAQVLLRYRGDFPVLSDFVTIRDLLAKDYGAPRESRSETDYSGSFPSFWIEADWRFPTTDIFLSLTDPNADPYSGRRKTLVLRYAPSAKR
ncbi:MAG: hypothetical protein ACREIP_07730 [Alphaproteobacteria bacterium]